jgi:hypothetical protein
VELNHVKRVNMGDERGKNDKLEVEVFFGV